jgi:VWFA-related protein
MGTTTVLLLIALAAAAQQVGQNAPPEGNGTATIRVSTQLVVEAVVVKDKKENPIEGLGAKDFTITENGAPQVISFCEHQDLPQTLSAVPAVRSEPEDIKVYYKLGRTRISPEPPGNIRYKDRRLLALYFDMTAMPPADQSRALAAAQKFIRTQMTPADRVSILRYSGGAVDVLQDFTDDHNRLLSILETMIVGEGQGFGESSNDASTSDSGAAFGQDDS